VATLPPLTEEEKRFLSGAGDTPTVEPLTPQEQAFMGGEEYVAPVATTGENVQHVLGGFGQAAVDTIDMGSNVSELASAASPWIPDVVKDTFRKVSPITAGMLDLSQAREEIVGRSSDTPGLKQAKEALTKEMPGAAPWAEYARTAAEWGAGGLAKVPKLVTSTLESLPNALRNIAPDFAAAAGASGGQAATEWLGGDGDLGELGGGVAGILLALKTGRFDSLTKAERQSLDDITAQFDSPEQAIASIEQRLAADEIGTVGDLSRSQGVIDLETAVNQMPATRRTAANVADRRAQQVYEDTLDPLQTGADATQAPYAAEKAIAEDVRLAEAANTRAKTVEAERVAGEQSVLTQARQQAEAQATQARGTATAAETAAEEARVAAIPMKDGQPRTTVEASESYAANRKEGRADYVKDIRKPAWDAVDEGPPLVTREVRRAGKKFLDEMDPDDAADLLDDPSYGKLIKRIAKWGDTVKPAVVTRLISRMKKEINDADRFGWAEQQMDDFVKVLEDELATPGSLYEKARAASKEEYARFEPGRTRKVARANEPETELQRMGTQGDKGASTVNLSNKAQVPAADRDLYDFILAEASRKGENITPDFLAQYEGAIDRMPAADKAKLQALVGTKGARESALKQARAAQDTADTQARTSTRGIDALDTELTAETNRLDKSLGRFEEGVKGDARGQFSTKANTTVDRLLKDPDGADELKALMGDMRDIAQVDSFKTTVKDRLEQMLFDAPADIQSKAGAYNDFLKMKDNLVEAGVLTQADADRMTAALERTKSLGLRKAARAADVTAGATEHNKLLASGLGAGFLAFLPASVNTLMIGGAVRRSLNNMLQGKVTVKRVAALEKYLKDPEKYIKAMAEAKTSKEAQSMLLTELVGAGQAAEIMAGEQ
jgi:hypothetical protein